MTRFSTGCLIALLFIGPLEAQEFTGTLQRIADTGKLNIGYVPDAPPISFRDSDGNVAGYAIDLCRTIAAEVSDVVGLADIEIVYVPLGAPEERLSAVENGTVDIECGATTVTLSRRERVDFTLMTFITGGSILSLSGDPISSIQELSDQTVAVIGGTTTEAALNEFIELNETDIELRRIATHVDGIQLLDAGEVQAYASDRAMLIGQVIQTRDPEKYTLARDVFSFEPHALMLQRGDTEFRLVADRALAALYRSARIRRLYHEWFGRYGEPLSPFLEAVYEFQAVAE